MALSAEDIMAKVRSQGIGTDKTAARELLGNGITEVLETWTNDVAKSMVEYLENNKRVGTSLAQGVTPLPVKSDGKAVEIELQAPSYWEFVDKGVSGLQNTFDTPFSFKFPSVSRSHAEAILNWIPKVGIQAMGDQTFEQVAYAIARSVKQKGINPTPFVTQTLTEARVNELEKAILDVTGESIKIKLRNGNNGR